jgi:hypothetical protein
MPLTLELADLYRRDLRRVQQQLEAIPDDGSLWAKAPHCGNSAGNLALHLEGNLREYVGRQLGGIAYQRQRDSEFTNRDISPAELAARFGELIQIIPTVIAGLTSETLDAISSEQVSGKPVTTSQFLIHLYGHLSYHSGQIDYSRRILTSQSSLSLAGL